MLVTQEVEKHVWKLTVRALEVEEVKAWETAVTTLDKLFSNVTSATVLDKLKPLYVLADRQEQNCDDLSWSLQLNHSNSFKADLITWKISFCSMAWKNKLAKTRDLIGAINGTVDQCFFNNRMALRAQEMWHQRSVCLCVQVPRDCADCELGGGLCLMHQQLQVHWTLVPGDSHHWVHLTLVTVIEQPGNQPERGPETGEGLDDNYKRH